MTIKEALKIKLSKLSLSDAEIDLILVEAKLVGSSEYDVTLNGMAVDLAYAGVLLTTIHVIEKKEDDVSIKYSTDLRGIYSYIMLKWGLPDPFAPLKPSVRQRNFW